MTKNVGVIGLGAMGMGIARSLLRAGFAVHVCDVRPRRADASRRTAASRCATPAELGRQCDVVRDGGRQRRADRGRAVRRAAAPSRR